MPRADTRPVYLNLLQIRLPVAGVMSIAHRLSGVVMALAIPAGLWLLQRSLAGPEDFAAAQALFHGLPARLATLLAMWALLHHLFAGIRYLLIDIEVGVHKPVYRYSAWAVLLAAPVAALALCLAARA